MSKTHEYLPFRNEQGAIGFVRTAVEEMTEKDKLYVKLVEERKAKIKEGEESRDPEIKQIILDYIDTPA